MSSDDIIADLQTRIAFQEDLLASLNDRVSQQDQEIDTLKFQLKHLNKKLLSLETPIDGSDEPPPPHY